MLISVLEKVFYFFGSDRRLLLLQDQVSVNRQGGSSSLTNTWKWSTRLSLYFLVTVVHLEIQLVLFCNRLLSSV